MKLFGLLKNKLDKNYLRVYGNLGRVDYSEFDKKELTDHLIAIANESNNSPVLKYDISGPGYGIAKGDSFMAQRAFNNRIKNKGYSKLNGLTVCSEKNSYNSGFTLFTHPNTINRIEAYFSWPYSQDESLTLAITIIRKLSEVMNLDYGYAYSTDSSLCDVGEGKITKSIFSISVSTPKSELLWDKHIGEINTGTIKKLFPINCLNQSQIDNLKGFEPVERQEINGGNEIWRFEPSELKKLNSQTANAALK